MIAPDLRRELNPPQLEAVLQTEGPMLVFAGAGSGKTRVITFRAAHIVSALEVPAWRVMCVTFTNKATGEMKHRLAGLLGAQVAKDLWVATFHATGAKLLRRYHERVGLSRDFAIYDESDQRQVMNRVYDDLGITEDLLQPRVALAMIDRFKQEVVSPAAAADQADTDHARRAAEVYANYEHRLAANNAVDFGDLLKKLVDLLEADPLVRAELQNRFRYLMIDEFQDTNAAQYRIVRALVGREQNLAVVGDDDQAIYAWRGADVRNIEFFKRDFPTAKIVKLEQNYRSTGRILKAANAVVQRLQQRESKVLFTQNQDGNKIELMACRDEREEAWGVASRIRAAHSRGAALKDMAVFYRIHAQSRPLEEAMRAANLPYAIVGGMRFYERAEVKDLLAYLRLTINPNDDVCFLRVVNVPARSIGKTTLDRLVVHARERKVSLWKLCEAGDYPGDLNAGARKRLSDFHTLVKGFADRAVGLAARPADLASMVLYDSGYTEMLRDDKSAEAEGRRENLKELIGSMEAYAIEADAPSLGDYLERVSLAEEVGASGDKAADKVLLMSVHSAKGLEFDTVFVTGLEEQMFPYKGVNPGDRPEELDEERRIAYVAITRARRQLVLSFVAFRQIFGTTRANGPSRFLREIPNELLSQPVPMPSQFAQRPVSGYGGGGYSSNSNYSGSGSSYSGGGSGSSSSSGYANRTGGGGSSGARSSDHPGSGASSVTRRSDAPAPASPDNERRVVYDEPMVASGSSGTHGFRTGMKVKHAKFGEGLVKTVEPGDELNLWVYFPRIGVQKRLRADFVRPV